MKGNGKAVPFHFRGGLQAAARIIRPPSAGEFHTCGLRRVISNAHVVGNDDQNYFASADAKVCDAWVRWAVSRPQGAKGADGVGIVSIVKTGVSGNVDTYTITLSNGSAQTFTVTNGTNGTDGVDGKTHVFTYINGILTIA